MNATIAKYTAAGWIAFPGGGGINDVIAYRGGPNPRLHFVQIVTDKALPRYNGLAKNTFIQNAFSNMAVPVYATVGPKDVSFENVNENKKIIVSAAKPRGG